MTRRGAEISACVLTYNHAHLIESTLESLLDQTIAGHEIIVSDDCSTDGTWDLLQRIAKRNKSVIPLRTPTNLGMAGNANFAARHTSRQFLALLHHDDLYRRDLLEKWAGVLERHPRAGFVFNQYIENGRPTDLPFTEECVGGPWLLRHHLLAKWGSVVRGTAMIRREAWVQTGGMDERYGLLADVDLWMRLCRNWDAGFVAEPLITVRQDRPPQYPATYDGGRWSWERQRVLYEIHASNTRAVSPGTTLAQRAQWARFVSRLNLETAKWLTYGFVKGNDEVLITSGASRTPYDTVVLRVFRSVLHLFGTRRARRHGRSRDKPARSPQRGVSHDA